MQPELAAAMVVGVGLGGIAVWAAWRYTRVPEKPKEEAVAFEPVFEIPKERPRAIAPRASAPTPPSSPKAHPARAPAPPPSSPKAHPERAPAMVLTGGVHMQDDHFDRRAPARPPPRSPLRDPPPMKSWAQQVREEAKPEVPTEWARRQVGPVGPGRVSGICGGCGARLSVSDARPLNIKCPVCGRAKLVA